jgi:mono/diheme cytochrome c family protein
MTTWSSTSHAGSFRPGSPPHINPFNTAPAAVVPSTMRLIHRSLLACILLLLSPPTLHADTPVIPATKSDQTLFTKQVLPILAHHCFECHANGKRKGGLEITSREMLLKGGKNGPAIVPGHAQDSLLIQRVLSTDEDERMPSKGDPLPPAEIAILASWIDRGAAWDPTLSILPPKPNFKPRTPVLPPGNEPPLDRLIAAYFAQQKIQAPAIVDDRLFARRVYLDVIGLLPSPEQLNTFLADTDPAKRAKLVDTLLNDNAAYADHWMSFWCDHLRSGTTLGLGKGADGKNVNVNKWLHEALLHNLPYDQFARDLIDPTTDDTRGFIGGLTMRGVVQAADRPEIQAAQNISQVFLGTALKCATCHDSFTSQWTQNELWGMAAVFTDQPMEIVRCEAPTGRRAVPQFIFPQLGSIDPALPPPARMERLATLVTAKENGLFSRTIANRLWSRLLGHGLIEPVDEMADAAWSDDMLDYLACDFVAHGYDLKHALREILLSQAYQLPSIDIELKKNEGAAFVFHGPRVRRLTAEQYADALASLAGVPFTSLTPKHPPGRAWVAGQTALQEALGRPDRNTVVTLRDSEASTLQALQMLTGQELNDWAQKIAAKMIASGQPRETMVTDLYLRTVCRPPTEREMTIATATLGDHPTSENVTDFVWVVLALPEFQLIR